MLTRVIRFLVCAAAGSGAAHAAVTFEGVEGELRDNLAEFVRDQPDCNARGHALREYAADLPTALQPALDAFGYYTPRVTTDIATETTPGARKQRAQADKRADSKGGRHGDDSVPEACWQIRVTVDPGQPVVIEKTNVALRGAARDDERMQALVAMFPLEPGAVLRHDRYRAFKSRLEALARERGYVDAMFAAERIDVYVSRHAADIDLAFDSGPRYAFGPITFATDALSKRVLDKFPRFARGDPYDASLVAQLQRDLAGSGYFASATVLPQFDAAAAGEIPLRVEATPAKPKSYTVGGGFSTDDGPRFSFSHDNVRRNRAGDQIHVDALISRVRQRGAFEYRVPHGSPQRDWFSYRIGYAREDIEAGVGSAIRGGVRHTRVREASTVTRFLDALDEADSDVGGMDLNTRLLLAGSSWAQTVRDDLVRPREGHRMSLELTLGVGDLALLQSDFRGKWIAALPQDARVIVRGRAGATAEREDFSLMPLSMRFFAGGDNSIRGYDYQSLGPVDAQGRLIGGDRLLVASVEYEHPVRPRWSIATFVDAGNAFLGSDFEPRVGAGIGARWFSPVGPIRIDIGWPIDAPAGESRSPRLHISLGPDL